MLESIITSKTRRNLLVKFFVNIANKGYLNSLANEFGESTNSVRKELNNLTSAGYLVKKAISNKIIYSANSKHPLFNVLQSIVRKHLGIEEILNNILNKIGSIDKIILLGDYAKGVDSGVIDVLIVGKNINKNFLKHIKPKIEKEIKRKINFLISSSLKSVDGLIIFQ
ncbi:MAG: transcriptional regulator [Pelagibacteraceae bacterium]|nr:transcriptional regulator [Pelagibacteraceae bacterium]